MLRTEDSTPPRKSGFPPPPGSRSSHPVEVPETVAPKRAVGRLEPKWLRSVSLSLSLSSGSVALNMCCQFRGKWEKHALETPATSLKIDPTVQCRKRRPPSGMIQVQMIEPLVEKRPESVGRLTNERSCVNALQIAGPSRTTLHAQ